MKIGIDARFLTHPQKGGFKTYSENLISALAEIDNENKYMLYFDRHPDQDTKLPRQPNFEYRVIPGQNPAFGMPWREQIGLPYWAARDRLDLLHSPCLTAPLRLNCASVVTIHDMIWRSSANNSVRATGSLKRKLMNWYYSVIPERAACNASLILTVSQASKDRITQMLGIQAEKMVVTYEAADPIFRKIHDSEQIIAVRKKYDLADKYVMAIGSADPRKNIATLVQAYSQLPANLLADYQLVIVWTHSLMAEKLMELVNDLDLSGRVRFITQVSNLDLVLLYNAASLFAFPSLDEGFGLPPLEAMACGTPVVAANNSSIPEVVGDSALLVDAQSATNMAVEIARVLIDGVLKAELIEKGLHRAACFSWGNCARQTISAYQSTLINL
jgi:glycosyltransferase involved in cell wall biosynthesis